MVNPFRDIDWNPGTDARRQFGRSLVLGFPVLAGVLLLVARFQTGEWAAWPVKVGAVGAAVGAVAWAIPRIALPFYWLWYGIGASMGLIISNVLLIATYALTLLPIGLVMRLLRRDPLRRQFDRQAPTYWKEVEPVTDRTRYLRQF